MIKGSKTLLGIFLCASVLCVGCVAKTEPVQEVITEDTAIEKEIVEEEEQAEETDVQEVAEQEKKEPIKISEDEKERLVELADAYYSAAYHESEDCVPKIGSAEAYWDVMCHYIVNGRESDEGPDIVSIYMEEWGVEQPYIKVSKEKIEEISEALYAEFGEMPEISSDSFVIVEGDSYLFPIGDRGAVEVVLLGVEYPETEIATLTFQYYYEGEPGEIVTAWVVRNEKVNENSDAPFYYAIREISVENSEENGESVSGVTEAVTMFDGVRGSHFMVPAGFVQNTDVRHAAGGYVYEFVNQELDMMILVSECAFTQIAPEEPAEIMERDYNYYYDWVNRSKELLSAGRDENSFVFEWSYENQYDYMKVINRQDNDYISVSITYDCDKVDVCARIQDEFLGSFTY